MVYAFLLFWPANVIPLWLMVSLMQLFIPLKLFLSMYFNKFTYYPKHILAAFGIFVAVGVNMVNLKDKDSADVRNDTTLNLICRTDSPSTQSCSYAHRL